LDIKLKNIKYSMTAKVIAFILVWLCFMSACVSAVFILCNYDVVNSNSYYDTYKFISKFEELSFDISEGVVKYKNNIVSKPSAKESANLAKFEAIKNKLSTSVNFLYYFKNTKTRNIISNLEDYQNSTFMEKQSFFSDLTESDYNLTNSSRSSYPIYYNTASLLSDKPFMAYAAIRKPLRHGDSFYTDFKEYSKTKTISLYIITLLAVSVFLALICSLYLAFICGQNENKGEVKLLLIDKIYTDVHTFLVFIAAAISVNLVSDLDLHDCILALVILGIDALIGLSYILSMIRQLKNKTLFKNSLIYKILLVLKRLVQLCFSGKIFKISTVLFLLGYGCVNSILFFITPMAIDTHPFLFLFCASLLLVFNIFAIYITIKALYSLTQLMTNVKQISNGNLDKPQDNTQISVAFLDFATDIESIKYGLKKAVDTAVKGERMKTELITNVSHDLKTPLTSIVNYVDLLKKEDLNNENALNYINILEEKSARLKQLIEDLVEASKASSGNLTVNTEKVDLHELIMQACGEYEEKFKNANLEIHIKTDDKKVLVIADGRHMWRIIENMLTNIIKYSMSNSRVYINIDKNDMYGLLTFKNISAFSLDIPPEQLTERFIRGDLSRNTEGSGLGLSIAQSLTNLQRGDFKIDIDGDLFKISIAIPLWAE
jgi:signal transduction histidine kinase